MIYIHPCRQSILELIILPPICGSPVEKLHREDQQHCALIITVVKHTHMCFPYSLPNRDSPKTDGQGISAPEANPAKE